MEAEKIQLVQQSFEKVHPIARQAAELFYARLFEIQPDVRPLFNGDMEKQGAMLMSAIGLAVRGLGRPETILPAVQDLGKRHAGYGVEPRHYPFVGEALLWTLQQGLGEEFTPEVQAAWSEAYTLLAGLMQAAAMEQ